MKPSAWEVLRSKGKQTKFTIHFTNKLLCISQYLCAIGCQNIGLPMEEDAVK